MTKVLVQSERIKRWEGGGRRRKEAEDPQDVV
jgi:hypothetical protein